VVLSVLSCLPAKQTTWLFKIKGGHNVCLLYSLLVNKKDGFEDRALFSGDFLNYAALRLLTLPKGYVSTFQR